jgi:hypothetical protein
MARKKRDGIYLHGKTWWCRDPLNSGRKVSTGFSRLEEKKARKWLAERKRASEDPANTTQAAQKLGDWCDRCVESKSRDGSPKTVKYYEQKLGHFVRLFGTNFPLVNILPPLCDTYAATRRTEGASDHTIVKEFSCLSQVLKLARRAGAYPHDIAALRPLDLAPRDTPEKDCGGLDFATDYATARRALLAAAFAMGVAA